MKTKNLKQNRTELKGPAAQQLTYFRKKIHKLCSKLKVSGVFIHPLCPHNICIRFIKVICLGKSVVVFYKPKGAAAQEIIYFGKNSTSCAQS